MKREITASLGRPHRTFSTPQRHVQHLGVKSYATGPAYPERTNTVPLDTPLGCRINVRGNGGKTTLAKAISRKQGMPFIELDDIHWLLNFVERDREEFRARTTEAIRDTGSRWVVDGNYRTKQGDLVTSQADMIVYLNLPWRVKFWRVLKRSIVRAWTRKVIHGGNVETRRQFLVAKHSGGSTYRNASVS